MGLGCVLMSVASFYVSLECDLMGSSWVLGGSCVVISVYLVDLGWILVEVVGSIVDTWWILNGS